MRRPVSWFALVTAAVGLMPGVVAAHFLLTEPPAMTVQGEHGDPQHTAPCGGDESAEPSGIVTPYTQGQTITITLDETIYHPGHFRVALAVESPDDLPPPPPVTEGVTECGSVPIQDPPVFPILADGVFPQDSPGTWPQSVQVTLPADVTCERCTLQVLKFTSFHDTPCFEYHCADISISAPPPPPECTADDDCGDDDQCTTDGCDDEAGACVHTPIDPASCDDGSVCTTDACAPSTGCTHDALTLADAGDGFLGDIAVPACASETVPGSIPGLFAQAGSFVTRAAASPTKSAKFLKRASVRLKKASKKTTKAGKRKISTECATAMLVALDVARSRVDCVSAAR